MDSYLIGLCLDYVELVEMYRSGSGQFAPEELHEIDSQRQVAHRQLCEYTKQGLDVDMVRHAKNILHYARAGGIQ